MQIKSLSVKMQIAMNILFVVVMAPLALSIYFILKSEMYNRSAGELSNTTELIRITSDLYVESAVKNHLRSIAEKSKDLVSYEYNLFKKGIMTEDEAYTQTKNLLLDSQYGKIGETGYIAGISSKGILVIHPKSEGADASGYDFMKKAISMKDGYLEYMWKNTGEETEREKAGYLSYFGPWDLIIWASSYKEEFKYLVDVDLLKSSLSKIIIGTEGYPIILDSSGNIVFHKTLATGNLFSNESLKELVNKSKENPHEVVVGFYESEEDKDSRLTAVVYDPLMDWYILTNRPSVEIFSIVMKIRNILIFVLIAAFIVMNTVIFLVFRWMLQPLRGINRIIRSVSEGDISQIVEISSHDEIGSMAVQFNTLVGSLQSMVQRMKEDVNTINNSIQELSSSSNEISTTSNEQASAVKEIVSTMEDSDSLSKGIETKVSEVAQIAEHSRTIVKNGVNHVEESLVKMEEIRVSNNDTISGIRSLGEKIEAIWEIVNIINSIADQTKIIAFNAELEASAAGDAGKNFQIVASEIRRLANSTVNSTTEIKTKINEIQHSSDRLITASEDGTNKIQEGGRLTEILHATFEDILETTEISADSATEISSSIRQQVIAFEQILLTLKQISEGINNFVISTKSTSSITRNMKEMSDNMSKFLGSYKTTSDLEDF